MKSFKLFVSGCLLASLLLSTMLWGENKGSQQDVGLLQTKLPAKSSGDVLTSPTVWNGEITSFQIIPNPANIDQNVTIAISLKNNLSYARWINVVFYTSIDANLSTTNDNTYLTTRWTYLDPWGTAQTSFNFIPKNYNLVAGTKYYIIWDLPNENPPHQYWTHPDYRFEINGGGGGTTVLYSENFEDRVADGWRPETSWRWSIAWDEGDWSYFLNSSDYSGGEQSALIPYEFSNFTFTIKVKSPENLWQNPYANYTLAFCCTPAGDWYCMRFSYNNADNTLFKSVGGQVANYYGPTFKDNQYHLIRISKDGNWIKVYFDNNMIINYYDHNPIPSGHLSIGSYNDAVFFDDIIVTGPGNNVNPTLLSENFENSFPGTVWQSGDFNWSYGLDYWDDQAAFSGARVYEGSVSCYCADISDIAGQRYDNNMDAYFQLINGLDLSGYRSVELTFWIWYDTEAGFDYFQLLYSYDNYNTLHTATNWKWSGASNGWQKYTFGLTNFGRLWLRFLFHSDGSITREGVYIDAISIKGFRSSGSGMENISGPAVELLEGEIPQYTQLPKENNQLYKDGSENASENSLLPDEYSLKQNYPNPFNPETTIEFSLPRSSQVELKIFNMLGQQIKTLFSNELPAGIHTIRWDGKDQAGNEVAGGTYLCVLKANQFNAQRKMTFMK